jgi:hypothetical protein
MLHALITDARHASRKAQIIEPTRAQHVSPMMLRSGQAALWQGALGNQAVLRMLQRKMTIGPSTDPLEAEADTMAERVTSSPPSSAAIRRQCACEDSATPCTDCQKKELHRKTASTEKALETPPIVDAALRRSGQPLHSDVREFMETRFGADFSGVRVHVDSLAAHSARAVHADAYTVGRDVVFAPGKYAPDSAAGRHLLAHELTHVVQQHGQPLATHLAVLQRQPASPPKTKEHEASTGKPRDMLEAIVTIMECAPVSSRESPIDKNPIPDTSTCGPAYYTKRNVTRKEDVDLLREWFRISNTWSQTTTSYRSPDPAFVVPGSTGRKQISEAVAMSAAIIDAVSAAGGQQLVDRYKGMVAEFTRRAAYKESSEAQTNLSEEIHKMDWREIGKQWRTRKDEFLNVASRPNHLNGHQLFAIWQQSWSDLYHDAWVEEERVRLKLWNADPVKYADSKYWFEKGGRDLLGPEYRKARDRFDNVAFLFSMAPEKMLAWLEDRVDTAGDRLTLTDLNDHAREYAEAIAGWGPTIAQAALGIPGELPPSSLRGEGIRGEAGETTAGTPGTQVKGEVPATEASLEVPQGLTPEQFASVSQMVRSGTSQYGNDVRVHGSRAAGTAQPGSDLDIAVRVPKETFDQTIEDRFGTPNPGSAKERTMQNAIKTGKIQAGEAGLRGLRQAIAKELGMDVDLSIVKIGGEFDEGPWIPLK